MKWTLCVSMTQVHAQGLSMLCRKCAASLGPMKPSFAAWPAPAIEKLSAITDAEFEAVERSTDFDDED